MRRPAASVASLCLVVAFLVATPAVAQQGDPAAELETAREELGVAERTLADIEVRLSDARRELDAVETRLADATAELGRVRDALAEAETALVAAGEEAAAMARTLGAATDDLDRARADRESALGDLEQRVRSSYMRGHAGLTLESLVRSRDLHQLNTTWRAMQTMADDDVRRVESAREAAMVESGERAEVAAVTHEARRSEARALAAQREVELLVRSQESLVAAIEQDRQARAATHRALDEDRMASAVLVASVRARVDELSKTLADALVIADPDAVLDGPRPAWASALPARGANLSPAIAGSAARAGVDGRLLAALVWSESNFHPGAVSHAGAIGLCQLMPGTARGLGVDPYDPFENLDGGARYLRAQLQRFGRADLALAAYNAGPGAVERYGRTIPPYAETQVYVLRVLERFEMLVQAS